MPPMGFEPMIAAGDGYYVFVIQYNADIRNAIMKNMWQ
jgi:hypothetical protein